MPRASKDSPDRPGQAETDPAYALRPNNIVDLVTLGRHLRALRVLAGFDRAADFLAVLSARYGIEVSERSLYAMERGEQMPHLDFLFAAIVTLDAPMDWYLRAVRGDVAEKLRVILRKVGDA